MPYADPEKRRACLLAWKAANPTAEKDWRAANQDRIRAACQARYAKNPGPKRARSFARRSKAPMSVDLLRSVQTACDGICSYCLGPANTVDHVFPLSRGGSNDPTNLVLACGLCNSKKRARTPLEFVFGWAA
jgi:5-methylcytosine-specific restriction endonuclease McrA